MRTSFFIVGSVITLGVLLWITGQIRQFFLTNTARDQFRMSTDSRRTIAAQGEADSAVPPIVQRYFDRAIPQRTTLVGQIELLQSGKMRMAPDKPWMSFSATQLFSAQPFAFVWSATISKTFAMTFHALDTLNQCKGNFSGELFGLVPLVGAAGVEINRSTLLRFLAESVWLPQALLPSDRIRWLPGETVQHGRAVLRCDEITISGVFSFNEQAQPIEFFTDERYRDVDGRQVRTDWRIEYRDHEWIGGAEIPRVGIVSWMLPDGPFETIQLRVEKVVPYLHR